MIKNERMFKLMLAVKRIVYALQDAKLQELEPTLTEIENLISDEMENSIPTEWIEHWKFTEPKYWEVVNGNDEIGRMLDDWRKENEDND